ncbi:C-C motif chemokine 8-like [Triplophysa rosa]|uniref:Cytokine SCM-1 beta-like n=1 Tax=Triplophysa rosa TaxID=992332 RepID=A0A9W8C785_TRIRA|nr:C-C motif chemokine 8-like [Triplophysa rosa]KAI7809921.1 putative cytokine SCM-1 beta-like [Triplophysa rosa]
MKFDALCFSAVLLMWLLVSTTAVQAAVIPESCLTTRNTKVPVKNLESYFIQRTPLYSVDAVRFLTKKGRRICSDPSSPWAKKAMKYLDKKENRQKN